MILNLGLLLFNGPVGAWTIVDMIVALIIICGVAAIAFIAMRAMGVSPPPWVMQIFWVVIIVVVAIFAIKIIVSLF